jgi:hypothetical protein
MVSMSSIIILLFRVYCKKEIGFSHIIGVIPKRHFLALRQIIKPHPEAFFKFWIVFVIYVHLLPMPESSMLHFTLFILFPDFGPWRRPPKTKEI